MESDIYESRRNLLRFVFLNLTVVLQPNSAIEQWLPRELSNWLVIDCPSLAAFNKQLILNMVLSVSSFGKLSFPSLR
jgi:hypothetical protein